MPWNGRFETLGCFLCNYPATSVFPVLRMKTPFYGSPSLRGIIVSSILRFILCYWWSVIVVSLFSRPPIVTVIHQKDVFLCLFCTRHLVRVMISVWECVCLYRSFRTPSLYTIPHDIPPFYLSTSAPSPNLFWNYFTTSPWWDFLLRDWLRGWGREKTRIFTLSIFCVMFSLCLFFWCPIFLWHSTAIWLFIDFSSCVSVSHMKGHWKKVGESFLVSESVFLLKVTAKLLRVPIYVAISGRNERQKSPEAVK